MTDGNLVLIERDGARAEIILNRPERKNALVGPLAIELEAAIAGLSADDSVATIVLRGAGGAFCSGLDLKEFNADPPPPWLGQFGELWRKVHLALYNSPKPIIGALERFAINGGSALALACDLLIVGEGAFLQVGEIQMGRAAPMNLGWLRARHPESVVARLTLIGDRVPGAELVRLGIATEAVPDDQVVMRARQLADAIAAFPAGSGGLIKAGFKRADANTVFPPARGGRTA
jgi:enoyl-CoA hydratase/carnithine racemase